VQHEPPIACAAIIFDMDGVLIDSEEHWDAARRALVDAHGGTYRDSVAKDVMGMNAAEWSRYLRRSVGVPLEESEIRRWMFAHLEAAYARAQPFFPGASSVVRELAKQWPVGLASASSRELIDFVVGLAGLAAVFRVTVSADEAGRGKPAPDVYLKAAAELGVQPALCLAVEDSSNGIRAARNAGMRVVAIPTADYPPTAEALALANATLARLLDLTPKFVTELFDRPDRAPTER